ncbi:plasmid segregation oscillating ATPase ParF [Mucilaginibacter gracilis]|uniref:Plasmid segregation oscillating ATPase ParF n=1 Tax=Mucilaginibacter gracilis TaxID=423350 RepID=A0A495IVX7_9SPHI|nr:ParA family protein [Mucilaginibacter gracilis]RKR80722.1 plasmid segregation oscillating ATPase ParF [Mucilaginibacter gracilis]
MSKIITIAHQKGGVGKSTLAINLALCFQDQLSVAIVDIDPQGSLLHIKDDFPQLSIIGESNLQNIRQLAFDLIIVDTPPYLSNLLPELFESSDFIVVPTKAGFFDVMAIRSTLALIKAAKVKIPTLKAAIILNMIKPRAGITNDVIDLLATMNTPILKTMIHDRVSIASSAITSGIINGKDQKAKEEITSLAEEIVDLIST